MENKKLNYLMVSIQRIREILSILFLAVAFLLVWNGVLQYKIHTMEQELMDIQLSTPVESGQVELVPIPEEELKFEPIKTPVK